MPAPPDKLRIQTTGGRENASPKEIEQAVNNALREHRAGYEALLKRIVDLEARVNALEA